MAEVTDRWHRSRRQPGDTECPEHKGRVATAEHGIGKRWQARWRDAEGKQRKENFERKADAEARVARVVGELAAGTYLDPRAGKVKLQAFAEDWLKAQTFDAATREAVERRLRLHVFPTLGDREVRSLRPSTVQAWMRGLQADNAPGHIRVVFGNLSAVLNAAVDDGLIPKNPCRADSVKRPKESARKIEPWPSERVAAVAEALPEWCRVMVIVGAGCGLRQGEIFGLSLDEVDWLRGVIHVRRQVKIVGGKQVFAPPKGGKERDVPLPQSVSLRLAAHLKAHPAQKVALPWLAPDGKPMTAELIFTTPEAAALNRNAFNVSLWKPALVEAGVIPPPEKGRRRVEAREHGTHALRHHYASVLLDSGVSIKALAEYLGHADPGFTLRVYTHLMPESGDRARRAVDTAINRAFQGAADEPRALDVPS